MLMTEEQFKQYKAVNNQQWYKGRVILSGYGSFRERVRSEDFRFVVKNIDYSTDKYSWHREKPPETSKADNFITNFIKRFLRHKPNDDYEIDSFIADLVICCSWADQQPILDSIIDTEEKLEKMRVEF